MYGEVNNEYKRGEGEEMVEVRTVKIHVRPCEYPPAWELDALFYSKVTRASLYTRSSDTIQRVRIPHGGSLKSWDSLVKLIQSVAMCAQTARLYDFASIDFLTSSVSQGSWSFPRCESVRDLLELFPSDCDLGFYIALRFEDGISAKYVSRSYIAKASKYRVEYTDFKPSWGKYAVALENFDRLYLKGNQLCCEIDLLGSPLELRLFNARKSDLHEFLLFAKLSQYSAEKFRATAKSVDVESYLRSLRREENET